MCPRKHRVTLEFVEYPTVLNIPHLCISRSWSACHNQQDRIKYQCRVINVQRREPVRATSTRNAHPRICAHPRISRASIQPRWRLHLPYTWVHITFCRSNRSSCNRRSSAARCKRTAAERSTILRYSTVVLYRQTQCKLFSNIRHVRARLLAATAPSSVGSNRKRAGRVRARALRMYARYRLLPSQYLQRTWVLYHTGASTVRHFHIVRQIDAEEPNYTTISHQICVTRVR